MLIKIGEGKSSFDEKPRSKSAKRGGEKKAPKKEEHGAEEPGIKHVPNKMHGYRDGHGR